MATAVKIFNHFETPKEPGTYFRLICLTGKNKGKAYFLVGKRVIMGRSEDADVTILDMKSSREHAEIISVGRDYVITDLGSQNGVVVNDLKIKQHTLANGDKIIIGKTVYKFSKVIIKENATQIAQRKREGLEEEVDDFNDLPENKKLNLGLIAVIVFAVILLFSSENKKKSKKETKLISKDINELAGANSFQEAIKENRKLSKIKSEKLSVYFHRGLREYRERNYFRALQEFQSALQWSPNDSQAKAYVDKTKERINEQIELYFSRAIRDTEAVKYAEAAVSYCNVVRLLIKNKDDDRYKNAVEGIKSLEEKMELDEGELKCVISEGGVK